MSCDPWPPWVTGEPGAPPTGGLAIDITNELFKRINIAIEIKIYPYKRCLEQMNTGQRDILLMAKKTQEREKYMLYSETGIKDPQLFYYSTERMDKFEWQSWEALTGYTVGVVMGFNYGKFDTAKVKYQIKADPVETDFQNLRKLVSGRVDLIILNKSNADFFMAQYPGFRGKIKAAKNPVDVPVFYFALSKKGRAVKYLPLIDEALNKMKADGTIDNILRWNE